VEFIKVLLDRVLHDAGDIPQLGNERCTMQETFPQQGNERCTIRKMENNENTINNKNKK
jgi:hypothetical protein